MSETEVLPPPDPALPPSAPSPHAAAPISSRAPGAPVGRGVWRLFGLAGFLLLAAGEGWLWHLYKALPPPAVAAPATDYAPQLAALQGQIAALQTRLTQAEAARAVTPPPAVAASAAPSPVSAPAAAAPAAPAPAALQDMADRIATLTALVNAVQTGQNADHAAVIALQAANTNLPRLTADVAALQAQGGQEGTAIAALQAGGAAAAKSARQLTVQSRIAAADMALQAGQPLGVIPDAPPALAAYATVAPPTEAQLLLAYPAASRAAAAASVAGAQHHGYWRHVLVQLEGLVTVTNGDRVVVGAPAAGALAQAQAALQAGDLNGAVTLLRTMNPAAQQAMAGWLGQAQGLLAARQALLGLAAPSQS